MSTALATLTSKLASRLDMGDGSGLVEVLKATAFKGQVSDAQMTALMVVANQYGLNPWTKEIYAFPDKNNGIVPVVGVDGWARIINNHPQFDGMEFVQDDKSCTCIIYRKDRGHPIKVTEYMEECKRGAGSGPWSSHPRRMLRHKAMIQCARIAFGYGGIYDQDEAERIVEEKVVEGEVITRDKPECHELPPYEESSFSANVIAWRKLIYDDRKTPDAIIAVLSSRAVLTEDQKQRIRNLVKPEHEVISSMTYAEVADELHKAGDLDTLDAKADLIRQVADEKQQAELNTLYHSLHEQISLSGRMIMVVHDVVQGSRQWLELRAKYFTASEAPAMLGLSKYQTRSELLRQKQTGLVPDVDAATQARFDAGHAAEAATRPLAEDIIGEDLFPVTGTAEVDGMPLLASFDGLTMDGATNWENKLWNDVFAAQVREDIVPDTHWPQLEQQMIVSGADRVLFTVSDGGDNIVHTWYVSDPARRAQVLAGWKQFSADLSTYQHVEVIPAAVSAFVEDLPALVVQVEGRVVATNMDAFKTAAADFIARLPKAGELETDQDFANADRAAKVAKAAEDRLDMVKQQAQAQAVSIDDVFRTIDKIKAEIRASRLSLEKTVSAEKDNRRAAIVKKAQVEITDHVRKLNERIGGQWMPVASFAPFAEAIKGLKSLDSMRDKVATALANAKIDANEMADRIELNRKCIDDMTLAPDFSAICTREPEYFAGLIAMRKRDRDEAAAARMEAERARIRAEEQAKAEREAQAKARAEQDARDAETARQRALEQEQWKSEQARQIKAQLEQQARERAENEKAKAEEAAQDQRGNVSSEDVKPVPNTRTEDAPGAVIREDEGTQVAKSSTPPNNSTIKLGTICERLGFTLTADFISRLGFSPVGNERAAKLYRESEFTNICAALVKHISTAAQLENIK